MNKYSVNYDNLLLNSIPCEWHNNLVRALQGKPYTKQDAKSRSFLKYSRNEPIELAFIAKHVGVKAAAWPWVVLRHKLTPAN